MPDQGDDAPDNEVPEIPESPEAGTVGHGHGGGNWLWVLIPVAAAGLPAVLAAVQQLFGVRTGWVTALVVLLAVLAVVVLAAKKALQENLPRASRTTRVLFMAVLVVVFAATGFLAVRFPQRTAPPPLHRFSETNDVAVVGFTGQGASQDKRVLDDVAATFVQSLQGQRPEGTTAWNYAPDTAPPLAELPYQDHRRLDEWTKNFIDQTNAGIVIGGIVTSDAAGQISLQPAFAVRPDQVVDAPELAGWYLSTPILLDQGWASPDGRAAVVAELDHRTRGLAVFIDALDAWRNGKATNAASLLAGLLPATAAGALPGRDGFVTPDLVELFHGHALEQAAAGAPAAVRSAELRSARADYQAIGPSGPLGRRALLSLADNTYLQALESAPTCRPGTVNDVELKAVSATLRHLAADPKFTGIGQLKASVNLAQVEQCRVTADPRLDDGTIDSAVQRVRSATDGSAVRELQALAISVAAEHAAGRGGLATAVTTIRQAISLEPRFIRRALWLGLEASWSLRRCDLATAEQAVNDSLEQLRAAISQGEVAQQRYGEYQAIFQQETADARSRCRAATGS